MTTETWCEGSDKSPDTMTFDEYGDPVGPCPKCGAELVLNYIGMTPQHSRTVKADI